MHLVISSAQSNWDVIGSQWPRQPWNILAVILDAPAHDLEVGWLSGLAGFLDHGEHGLEADLADEGIVVVARGELEVGEGSVAEGDGVVEGEEFDSDIALVWIRILVERGGITRRLTSSMVATDGLGMRIVALRLFPSLSSIMS